MAFGIAGMGLAVTLWQVVQTTRAARDTGTTGAVSFAGATRRIRTRFASRAPSPGSIVVVLLLVKLCWTLAGITGALPGWLGGGLGVWQDVRDDGMLSWLIAGLIVTLTVVWLLAGCPGPGTDEGMATAVAGLLGCLVAAEAAFQLLSAMYISGAGEWAFDASNWVEQVQPWSVVLAEIFSVAAFVVLWFRGRRGAGMLLLAAFAVWAGIRLPAIISDLVRYPWFPWGLSMPSEFMYGERPGWVNLATVDLGLTAALLGLVLASRRVVRVGLVPILIVAISSASVVYAAVVVENVLSTALGAGLAFLIPFLYLYLLDAEQINKADATRATRVLGVVALSTLAITIGLLRGARGSPLGEQDQAMAAAVLVVPVLVTTVVVTLARMQPRRAKVETAAGR